MLQPPPRGTAPGRRQAPPRRPAVLCRSAEYALDSAMDSIKIRDAKPSDRDAIIAFDHGVDLEPGRIPFIDRVLSAATCLVAESEGRVVAYGSLEYTFYDNGFVSMLQVAEPQRRRGIGRSLMEALAARCTTPKLFTSTNESNKPMHALLHFLGYVPSGVIENLDVGDPEIVYFLDLRGRAGRQQHAAERAARRR